MLGNEAGPITKLVSMVETEIAGIDIMADKEEIMEGLRKEIPGDDSAAAMTRRECFLTGLWTLKSGNQIATLRIPRSVVNTVSSLKIGWTKCTMRLRRTEPPRCFRCHGFGHTSRSCNGPDIHGTCRRCGNEGHVEKECSAGNDRCVACERSGYPKANHRPGSGSCAARRAAYVTGNAKK